MRGLGEETRCEVAEVGDVGGVDGLVEADVFDGGSDDGAGGVGTGGAGDDVDVGSADDDVELERGWERDDEHLAFLGSDAEVGQRRGAGGPGSGAVDELCGVEGAGGGVDLDALRGGVGGEDLCVWAEVYICDGICDAD